MACGRQTTACSRTAMAQSSNTGSQAEAVTHQALGAQKFRRRLASYLGLGASLTPTDRVRGAGIPPVPRQTLPHEGRPRCLPPSAAAHRRCHLVSSESTKPMPAAVSMAPVGLRRIAAWMGSVSSK